MEEKTSASLTKAKCFVSACHLSWHVAFFAALLLLSLPAFAQKAAKSPKPPSSSGASTRPVLQLKRLVNGNFVYRFLTPQSPMPPAPLPSPSDSSGAIAIPLPANLPPHSQLEVIDTSTGKVAHLPVQTGAPIELTSSSFTLAQVLLVPVQVEGKGGLINALVTLMSGDGTYHAEWLLKPSDKGVAQFFNVPLDKPLTVTVQYDNDPPISQTQTLLPSSTNEYRWPPISVTWPDAQSVPLNPPSQTSAPNGPPAPTPAPGLPPTSPPPTSSPLSDILSTLIGIAVLAGAGYGLFWAYKQGHLRRFLEGLGLQVPPPNAQDGSALSPFKKQAPQEPPLPPLTEGTADPLGGSIAPSAASLKSEGPRLVGTIGVYAGQIFPLPSPHVEIGRDPGNHIVLAQDNNVSRRHATILNQNGQFMVIDNNSSNGTLVNGVRIPPQTPHPLRPGDELQLGMTRFRFEG